MMAVVAAEQHTPIYSNHEPDNEYVYMDRTRHNAPSARPHSESNPNWMRGFYDHYPPEGRVYEHHETLLPGEPIVHN